MSSTPEQLEMAAALLGDAMAAADDDDDTRFSLVHAALFAVAEHTREEKGLTELAAQTEWIHDTTGGLRWILGAARLRLLVEAAHRAAVPACEGPCAEMGGGEDTALICSARGCQRERTPNWAGIVHASLDESRP